MKKLVVFMAHSLTPEQKEGWDEIVDMKEKSSVNFTQIDPEATSMEIYDMAQTMFNEAREEGATHVSLMGEPCLMHNMYMWCANNDITFVQSTTRRESKDIPQEDGSVKKISVFRHVQWREWEI